MIEYFRDIADIFDISYENLSRLVAAFLVLYIYLAKGDFRKASIRENKIFENLFDSKMLKEIKISSNLNNCSSFSITRSDICSFILWGENKWVITM